VILGRDQHLDGHLEIGDAFQPRGEDRDRALLGRDAGRRRRCRGAGLMIDIVLGEKRREGVDIMSGQRRRCAGLPSRPRRWWCWPRRRRRRSRRELICGPSCESPHGDWVDRCDLSMA
jgi:hypothetical protein